MVAMVLLAPASLASAQPVSSDQSPPSPLSAPSHQSLASAQPLALVDEIYQQFQPIFQKSIAYGGQKQMFLRDLDGFEAGPVHDLLSNSSPAHTLEEILGVSVVEAMSPVERVRIITALEESFRRYAYEWLEDQQMGALTLVGVGGGDRADRAELRVRRSADLSPDFTFRVDVVRRGDKWLAYDFGIFGVSYTGLKRAIYRARLDRGGAAGLAEYLESKNRIFFDRFCGAREPTNLVVCNDLTP